MTKPINPDTDAAVIKLVPKASTRLSVKSATLPRRPPPRRVAKPRMRLAARMWLGLGCSSS
jgi:hypothetical protein